MAGSSLAVTEIADFVASAEQAAERVGSTRLQLAPAGVGIGVTLVGERVTRALAGGLYSTPGATEAGDAVQLYAFDTAESGVRLPPPPWPPEAFGPPRREIEGFTEGPRLAHFDNDTATLSYFDERAAAGVQWFRDAEQMAVGEGGGPLRDLLRWALADRDVNLAHLACVGGLLLGGAGGSGKSTTSLICARAGFDFTSDDFCAVDLRGAPRASAVFAYAKATTEARDLVPEIAELGPSGGLDWRDKLRIDMSARIVPEQEVTAIVLPKVAARTGRPREIKPLAALKALSNGSFNFVHGGVQRSLTQLRELVGLLPAYELEVGPDIDAIPEALAGLPGERITR